MTSASRSVIFSSRTPASVDALANPRRLKVSSFYRLKAVMVSASAELKEALISCRIEFFALADSET